MTDKKSFSNQGLTFCRADRRTPRIGKTSSIYCTVCGFRKRGANHDQGKHHQSKKKILENS